MKIFTIIALLVIVTTSGFSTSRSTLRITSSVLPNAIPGVSYSTNLTASGGRAPYIWSIQSGSLPSGLTLSSVGHISGVPSKSGSWSFTVMVKDSSNRIKIRSKKVKGLYVSSN